MLTTEHTKNHEEFKKVGWRLAPPIKMLVILIKPLALSEIEWGNRRICLKQKIQYFFRQDLQDLQ
jgi:hypothetical protein